MSLKKYNKKRDFSKTPEPQGKVSHAHKNLFVIQKHAASHLHYDFRLELNGVLLSWAVPKGPCLDPAVRRLAMHVEDHPVEYGHFEGIIPQGEYGGGTVMLWDVGKWAPEDEDPVKAYHQGHLHFTLKAKKLNGKFNLIKLKKDDDKSWFLIKSKDKYAKSLKDYDITQEKPDSVLSGKNLDEIAESYNHIWSKRGLQKAPKKKANAKSNQPDLSAIHLDLPASPMPTEIYPQLATLVDKAPSGEQWVHELKFDGYRILAFKQGRQVRLMSRNNKDWTDYFKNVLAEIKILPVKNVILDGEVVLLDEQQHPSFQLLQNSIKSAANQPFVYYIFDILYYDKYNLMPLPLAERKKVLNAIITSTEAPVLRYSAHFAGSGKQVFDASCQMGLEGIVCKLANSPYVEARTKTWVKVKCSKEQEFIIGGYSPPKKSRQYFGSLFLGVYNKNHELVYCGNVGTGFTQQSLQEVYAQLQKYKTSHNPFNTRPPGVTTATWIEPKLVAQVEFSAWTNEGILRHPSFKGLRMDKPPATIKKEEAVPVDVPAKKTQQHSKLTNPKKVLYPEDGITKLNVADYYQTIEDWILPYITDRPLMLVRCPETYKKCFYQKHVNETTPNVLHGVNVVEKEKIEKHIYIKNREGLMALAQMGVLEIHPWGCKVTDIDFPDWITFDLDPAPDIAWKKMVETALLVKKHLAEFKLRSFLKTTGGKGLHIVVPILPEYDWETVKHFSHIFVKFLMVNYPDQYVSEMSKAKRKGKIFIDYLRNQKGATSIAPYSTRARTSAPVSVPIDWDELSSNFEDTFYTIFTLPQRLQALKKDPWHEFFKVKQSLALDKLK